MKLKMQSDGKKGIIPFSLGVSSSGISYVIIGMLTYCLTTSYAMSGTLVGIIMLISRCLDGITDILAGIVIDKMNSKIGKTRLIDLFHIPMWILLMLCFDVPAFSTMGKAIYVFIIYNLCQSVFFTFVSVASPIRVKRSFVEEVRAKALTVASIVAALLGTVLGIINPLLISRFENQPHGWLIITGAFAVPGILMALFRFLLLPEMDQAEENTKEEKEHIGFAEAVKQIFQNPYIVLIALAIISSTLSGGVSSTAATYYYTYNMGDLNLASIVGMITLFGYVLVPMMPAMTKKFGNRKSAMISYFLLALANIGKLIMPQNIIWLAVCNALSAACLIVCSNVRDLMVIDCMRFGELKTGRNGDGVYSAVRGFADKIATGLSGFIVGVILDLGHFDGEAAVQSAGTLSTIKLLITVIPAIIAFAGFVCMYFCRLEDRVKEMEQEQREKLAD